MEAREAVYLDGEKASQMLNIKRQTLANWRVHRKGPRYIKSGRLVRYALSDIMNYMESRKIGTQDQPKEGE